MPGQFATPPPVADMTPADIAAHGIPLSVVAQRKVEAAVAKRQQALRADQWTAANWWQKEADVWQEVLDILGAQAGQRCPSRTRPYRWQDHAACRGADPALFFPAQGESTAAAKAICASCDVRQECLDFAMATASHDDFGVWGGTTGRDRRRMRRDTARQHGLPERQCPHCEETFTPATPRQMYCTTEHTTAAAHRAYRARKREAERQAS